MTPDQWEGVVLGYALAFVAFALVAGWITVEWHLSAKDRARRKGRVEW